MEDITNLKRKVERYKEVLANTRTYRKVWDESLKKDIIKQLQEIIEATDLIASIEEKETLENMEAIVLSLGESKSGIYEQVNETVKRHLIKHHGSLIYQQLFNGKILALISYPFIEGYGKPRPPKNIAIYRPEEIKPPFILRHMEEFIKELTLWEDYDDDEPSQKIGFNLLQATPTTEK